MKQTAVEWLLENLNSEPYSEEEFNYNSDCWDKAMAMEKEQMHSEYMRGWKDGLIKQETK
jgi:predicted GIY-YIG superfamily endonuclease